MLRAVLSRDDDLAKPLIALGVLYTKNTPSNDHIRELGDLHQLELISASCMTILQKTAVYSSRAVKSCRP
ncbi:MAG: dihydroxy-acid dehydratase [Desulforhopalus sp.]|jgi:dihydroxy-acid dehydratase